jgi:preprotein translocase subunit YajC
MFAVQLVAQDPKTADGKAAEPPLGNFLVPFLLIGLLFYFLMLRPARRQEKDRLAMIEAVKKNDKVVTSSGIVGTVVSLKKDEEEILLESGNSKLRVLKSSIARVLPRTEAGADESDNEDKDGEEKK